MSVTSSLCTSCNLSVNPNTKVKSTISRAIFILMLHMVFSSKRLHHLLSQLAFRTNKSFLTGGVCFHGLF